MFLNKILVLKRFIYQAAIEELDSRDVSYKKRNGNFVGL